MFPYFEYVLRDPTSSHSCAALPLKISVPVCAKMGVVNVIESVPEMDMVPPNNTVPPVINMLPAIPTDPLPLSVPAPIVIPPAPSLREPVPMSIVFDVEECKFNAVTLTALRRSAFDDPPPSKYTTSLELGIPAPPAPPEVADQFAAFSHRLSVPTQ
jgi:hypothetical protein